MSVLERGGNAFDAVIAGAFVLVVAEPDQNGLGGEVPVIVRTPNGDVSVICGQGFAPAAATSERFAKLGLDLIPGSGVLPACVPGSFDAWMLLAREYATLPLRELLGYAIGYARDGVPVSAGLARRLGRAADNLRARWPSSVQVYLAAGVPHVGSLLRNASLAAVLERIVREAEAASGDRVKQIEAARKAWRSGFVAEAVFRWLRDRPIADVQGRSDVALLAFDDWTAYEATIEEPISGRYANATIYKAGPWSQGGVLIEALALFEEIDAPRNSAAGTHALIESLKLALADREAWYGDPRFSDVPVRDLLSGAYARDRRGLIGDGASRELRPGSPAGRAPRLPAHVTAPRRDETTSARAAEGAMPTHGDTAHIDVADRDGNIVSATPSGGWLQSSPVIPELGFPLGTRAQMFWLEQGLPNSLGPRKRPRTTLTPAIVVGDDGAILGCGSPGGDGQDQWAAQLLVHHLGEGLSIHDAVEAPTFNSFDMPLSFWPRGRRPGVVQMEADWDPAVVEELRRRGHEVEIVPAHSQGWPCAVRVTSDGIYSAAASARERACAATVR